MDSRQDGMTRSSKASPPALHPALSVRVAKESVFFGSGPCKLLRLVAETGSLEAAARAMEMSYTKARKMIQLIEKELGMPVVIRHSGGLNGGSSRLTEDGERFIQAYMRFSELLHDSADQLFHTCFSGFMTAGKNIDPQKIDP